MAATKEHSKLRQLPGLGLRVSKEPFKTQEGGWVGEADPLGIWEVTRIQTLRGCRVWVKNLGLDPKKNRKQ